MNAQVVYTLWTRFMDTLSKNPLLSGTWVKPTRLDFFEDNQAYLQSFDSFNLASKLEAEKAIEENGNSCNEQNPVVIRYDRCSDDFISLWTEAGKSMQVIMIFTLQGMRALPASDMCISKKTQAHIRKKGPAVVPGRSALIWPGLTIAHFLKDSIPAWSLHARNVTQV